MREGLSGGSGVMSPRGRDRERETSREKDKERWSRTERESARE